MMQGREMFFACVYSGLSCRYLRDSEWEAWAELLLGLALMPKRWVVELASVGSNACEKLNEALFDEMNLNTEPKENLFQSLHEMLYSFIYIKYFINGAGDKQIFLNALEEMGFSDGQNFDDIMKLVNKNLDVCLYFISSMNDVDFLKRNRWIYEQS